MSSCCGGYNKNLEEERLLGTSGGSFREDSGKEKKQDSQEGVSGGKECIIDCSVPFMSPSLAFTPLPDSEQLPNRVRGKFCFNGSKVKLYLSEKQKGRGLIEGHELLKELVNKRVLPAQVFYHLLQSNNSKFIPDSWVDKRILFWGTILGGPNGQLAVVYLFWHGTKHWRCSDNWNCGISLLTHKLSDYYCSACLDD